MHKDVELGCRAKLKQRKINLPAEKINLPIANPHMLKEATCQKDAGIKARGLAEEKHKAAAGLSMLSLYRDKARPLMLIMLDRLARQVGGSLAWMRDTQGR